MFTIYNRFTVTLLFKVSCKMERKYGVSLIKLQELKNFQLRNRAKRKPEMNVIGRIFSLTTEQNGNEHVYHNCELSINQHIISIATHIWHFNFPISDIVSYNITPNLRINIQFTQDFVFDRCILELRNDEELRTFLNLLPKIERPPFDDDNESYSSDTDTNDSGMGKTNHLSDEFSEISE